MTNLGTYEFNSICNVMDFIKPLIVEGYSVTINKVYKDFPYIKRRFKRNEQF